MCKDGPTDKELGNLKMDYIEETYEFPAMVGHRSELANAIYDGCRREGSINFFFSTKIEQIDISSSKPSFIAIPCHGESQKQQADILLGADGVKSKTRVAILEKLGEVAEVEDTGQACYRIPIKKKDLTDDPELLDLINSDHAVRWIGDQRMIIGYPVANKSIFNISTTQPDVNFAAAPSQTYTTRGSKSAMLEVYSGFNSKIQRLLKLVPEGEVCEWKLRVHQPLPAWHYGSTALLGDACHPMLPHLAQGAAQAIEDAAVLTVVLSRLPDTSADAIDKAFQMYEKVRKSRAEILVHLAHITGVQLRLGEGAAREERDKMLADIGNKTSESPDKWTDRNTQNMIFGHDCVQAANAEIDNALGAATLGR